jgi:hypothetical protein
MAQPTMVPWPNGLIQSQQHSYSIGGLYDTSVTIANNFNSFSFNCSIIVYGKIENISLITNSPVPLVDGKAEAKMWFYALKPPANISLVWNYGDGKYNITFT